MRKRAAIFTFALGALASAAVLPKVFGFGNLAPATEVKAPIELIVPARAGNVSFSADTISQTSSDKHRMKLLMQGDVMVTLPGKVRLRVPSEQVVLVKDRKNGESRLYLGAPQEK
jgi:hypothetical protein